MGLEKEKKRKRRISLLVVALIAILLATVLLFWYTHQNGTEKEKYSVHIEDGACNITVTETLPSRLRIDIDSLELYTGLNYTVRIKNVTFYFYVTQEIESKPVSGFEEKETSILYWIRLENCSFSRAMITFYELHYFEDRLWRDYLFPIEIREDFTSFFMEFETFKEDG